MEISELEKLDPDLFLQYITYLPFNDVISVCTSSVILHKYCHDEKYRSKWKSLIDNTFSRIYNYPEKLKEIQRITKSDYNYLVYTQLVNLLDPITKLMIYYRQGDMKSFEEGTKEQKFLALFLLNKKDIIKDYLPYAEWTPFIDFLNGGNISQDDRGMMLAAFALEGNIQGIQLMEKHGAEIGYNNNIPLRAAVRYNQLDVVKYLISRGADPRAMNNRPIRLTGELGHFEILKYLQSLGVDIHVGNEYVFYRAVQNGHLNVVKYLVEGGVDIHANNNFAIRSAAANNRREVIDYLLNFTPNKEERKLMIDLALPNSSLSGNIDLVKYLLDLGANIHFDNELALRFALEEDLLDVAKFLIQQGANLDLVKNRQLVAASAEGRLETVKFLVENGANEINQALDAARQNNRLEVINYLESLNK